MGSAVGTVHARYLEEAGGGRGGERKVGRGVKRCGDGVGRY